MDDYTTEYLKKIWDYMASEDGDYGLYRVSHMGHVVNGLFIDDVYFELHKRGESRYASI